ncbi:cobaltochelatase subunit CobN [Afifella sp. IM 167]|uniref:cobaltochelatase subunit CobN n=1 Tax=Afifella sp. IM 167 TaxID=2033586 RepID=UPI001CCBBA67|nr:cobaltochelatase subunit CobN [Afifella sp. IM 167]MBZ8132581.1 cobaltochelatase subunit CobN [Afifella sp. IM 167]
MHILRGQSRGLDAAAEAVDLGQSPGDIVVLSAADTEIAGLAAAANRLPVDFPSIRLANWMGLAHPYSVDLYVESVLAHARLVVLRLLGGIGYWRYGVEETLKAARASGARVALLPGEAKWDFELAAAGSLGADESRLLWSYLAEGGAENFDNFLRFAGHLAGHGAMPKPPEALPAFGLYRPETMPRGDGRAAAIVFYRALLQSGQTAPVDALAAALAARGLDPLPVFVSSLKQEADSRFVAETFAARDPALVINATAFALGKAGDPSGRTVLDDARRPVLQATFAGVPEEKWREHPRGLSPSDLTMNVVLPEVDGRLITRAVSFKEEGAFEPRTECRPMTHRPLADRVDFVGDLAAGWARLAEKPNAEKRIGIVLSNYPNKDGRLANGVGLDAPASTANLIRAMAAEGFDVSGAPESGEALMEIILAGPTNALAAMDEKVGGERLSLSAYEAFFQSLPAGVRRQVSEAWGAPEADPFFSSQERAFRLALHRFGGLAIGVQPARGYNIDPKTSYHDPALVPPHGYFAFYAWLRREFRADALVHMGKHGNLEWLPGKALALSEECFPEAALGPTPLVYPFIVNDPGEGAQAKRRASAVIVDHLMPPMTRAESHGAAAELEYLIDEYAAADLADQRRAKEVAENISEIAGRHGFLEDLGLRPDAAREEIILKLDEQICDLKELQIRDGLHILGESPEGRLRADTLVALARVPRASSGKSGVAAEASLLRALSDDLGLSFDPLDCAFHEAWAGPRPKALARLSDVVWRTTGDTVERLELLAAELVAALPEAQEGTPPPCGEGLGEGSLDLSASNPNPVPGDPLPNPRPQGGREQALPVAQPGPKSAAVLKTIAGDIAPRLDASGSREIEATLAALSGKFIPPGPSGAPTRGRDDCLPTGRNFYSVDVRGVPTRAAYALGRRSADLLAERYYADEGEWPAAMALTVWGTSNMRTGGDDIAQALALLGVKPQWEPASGRVTGIEVIPLSELMRPRIDVTLRISGLFRDAFPHQIDLFHQAVLAVAERDEPADANPVAARIREESGRLQADGLSQEEARRAAAFRVFGSRPGAYGAGLQALIDEGIWEKRGDLASAFLEWSSYAYGGGAEGEGGRSRGLLETRLKATDAIVQNQDNREHDLLDSDDYYQFEGGLSSAVETLKGSAPRAYHNDHSRPERPVIRGLDEELARVVRGRAANPKWIAGVMRHGYKGAFEIAATVDYLFAFAATTPAVKHHHFDQLYGAYLEDEDVRDFLAENNAPALKEIAQRFSEAIERGLWVPHRNSVHRELALLAGGEKR